MLELEVVLRSEPKCDLADGVACGNVVEVREDPTSKLVYSLARQTQTQTTTGHSWPAEHDDDSAWGQTLESQRIHLKVPHVHAAAGQAGLKSSSSGFGQKQDAS
jgi:hypothetical protein